MGSLVDRTHRELTPEDIERIAATYHAWRGDKGAGEYADEAGFCFSASVNQIAEHSYVLTPGRYVGAADADEDDEPFDEKFERLMSDFLGQSKTGRSLTEEIESRLRTLTGD